MVYGAFSEKIMHKAYTRLLQSPLGKSDLVDSAIDICAELDRLLVEQIWPEKAKRQQQTQVEELKRSEKPALEEAR